MSAVTVRGVALGQGRPKIIVPIFAQTAADAAGQAAALGATAADLAELRLDPLRAGDGSLPDAAALCVAVRRVRAALDGRLPLLVTLRTGAEGGSRPCTPEEYAALLGGLLDAAGAFELLDVEFAAAGPQLPGLCRRAQAAGLAVVASKHDFAKTPPRAEMAAALCAMGDAGADIAKLAVMPTGPADAAELLAATALARSRRPALPLITMAMGPAGAVTRVCGGAFGSCATFGTAGVSSAPGQPDAARLRAALDALGGCLA